MLIGILLTLKYLLTLKIHKPAKILIFPIVVGAHGSYDGRRKRVCQNSLNIETAKLERLAAAAALNSNATLIGALLMTDNSQPRELQVEI